MAPLAFVGDSFWIHGPILLGPAALADQLQRRFADHAPYFEELRVREGKAAVLPELVSFGPLTGLVLPHGNRTAWVPLDERAGLLVRTRSHLDPKLSPWEVPEERWEATGQALELDASWCLFDSLSGDTSEKSNALRAVQRLAVSLPPGRYQVERVPKFLAGKDELFLLRLRPEGHVPARPAGASRAEKKPAAIKLTAASKATAKKLKFLESGGGPLIALPVGALKAWRGTGGTAPTDYDRACAVTEPAGVIDAGQGLVLASPDSTAFLPTKTGGVFLRWAGADIAADLIQALAAAKGWEKVKQTLDVEEPLVLFNAAADGSKLGKGAQRPVPLKPGKYSIEACEVTAEVTDGKKVREVIGGFLRLVRR